MATGWAREGAVQDQIDDTVSDAVAQARRELGSGGPAATHCDECGEPIPEPRRAAVPGVRLCIACQEAVDQARKAVSFNRRASKDSQLR